MMPVQGEKYVEISKNTAIVTLTISAVLLSLSKKKRLIKMIYPVLFAVVAGELLIDNAIVIYGERTLMTKETYAEAYWDRDMETLVDYVNDLEGDNFVRIDRTYKIHCHIENILRGYHKFLLLFRHGAIAYFLVVAKDCCRPVGGVHLENQITQ